MQPTEDRVILKPVPPDTKTKSGLIIPDTVQKVQLWEVVAVGPQVANKISLVGDRITIVQNPEVHIKPGAFVMIPQDAGIDFEEDGQPRKVIRHSSIELYSYSKWKPVIPRSSTKYLTPRNRLPQSSQNFSGTNSFKSYGHNQIAMILSVTL